MLTGRSTEGVRSIVTGLSAMRICQLSGTSGPQAGGRRQTARGTSGAGRRHRCASGPGRARPLRGRPDLGTRGHRRRHRGRLPAGRRGALRKARPGGHRGGRADRDRAPPGPAGLGADRPAARRPAGQRGRAARAALHHAAAARGARGGHHPRPDVLHRAGRAQRGHGHVLQVRHPHRGPAGHPADRAVQGDPGRAGPGGRRRPDPDRRRLPRRGPHRVPPAQRRSGCARCPTGSACTAAPTWPTWAGWSRARTCPR